MIAPKGLGHPAWWSHTRPGRLGEGGEGSVTAPGLPTKTKNKNRLHTCTPQHAIGYVQPALHAIGHMPRPSFIPLSANSTVGWAEMYACLCVCCVFVCVAKGRVVWPHEIVL